MEELTQQQIQLLKDLTRHPGWRISLGLWERLLILKEKEKSEALKIFEFDEANRAQGIIDGVKYCMDEIEAQVRKPVLEDVDPRY